MWRYLDNTGSAQGPLPEARLLALLKSGEISASTLVWRAGQNEWRRLGETQLGAWLSREEVLGARPLLAASPETAPAVVAEPQIQDILSPARSVSLLGWIAAVMQGVAALIHLFIQGSWVISAGSLAGWMELERARQTALERGELAGEGLLLQAVMLFQIFLLLLLGVQFIRWQWRASRNLHSLGAQKMRFAPWTALFWLIPGVNLVLPFLVLDEIQRASRGPQQFQKQRMSAALRQTWMVWLFSRLAGVLAYGLVGALAAGTLPSWLMPLDLGVVWLFHGLLLIGWIGGSVAIVRVLRVVHNTTEEQLRQVTRQISQARSVDWGEPV